MSSTIPDLEYGLVQKPGHTSQTGCMYCLAEGIKAPVDIVYFWGGTSMCSKHLEAEIEKRKSG